MNFIPRASNPDYQNPIKPPSILIDGPNRRWTHTQWTLYRVYPSIGPQPKFLMPRASGHKRPKPTMGTTCTTVALKGETR